MKIMKNAVLMFVLLTSEFMADTVEELSPVYFSYLLRAIAKTESDLQLSAYFRVFFSKCYSLPEELCSRSVLGDMFWAYSHLSAVYFPYL